MKEKSKPDNNVRLSRGCFFCKSGKEADVVRHFNTVFPKDRAIVPTRTRYRRTQGVAIEETLPLMPGYVFFEIREEGKSAPEITGEILLALIDFSHTESVLRLLRYTDEDWRLKGSDDRFAEMLFRRGGNIGISKAFFDEGDRIRIVDGFLKDYEGEITRVNRKNKTVEVRTDFKGKLVTMQVGYELVASTTKQSDESEWREPT